MAYFQTDNLWVNRLADGVADLVLDVAGGHVNALNRTVLAELELLTRAIAAYGLSPQDEPHPVGRNQMR